MTEADRYCKDRLVGGWNRGPKREHIPKAMRGQLPRGRSQKELRAMVLAHLPAELTDFAAIRVAIERELRQDGGMEFCWQVMPGAVSVLCRPDAIARESWSAEEQHFHRQFAAVWSDTQKVVVERMVTEAGGRLV